MIADVICYVQKHFCAIYFLFEIDCSIRIAHNLLIFLHKYIHTKHNEKYGNIIILLMRSSKGNTVI